MTQNKIKQVLEQHTKWLNSDGKEGKKADFGDVNLKYTDFRGADLRGANFSGANLKYADFKGADLRGANFKGVDLRYVDFKGADLGGANFKGVDLRYVDLRGANFKGVDLRGADLRGVNLDFSVFPLWCGSFDIQTDKRLPIQLAYHICRMQSDNPDVLAMQTLLAPYANMFHRVNECGVIQQKKETENETE